MANVTVVQAVGSLMTKVVVVAGDGQIAIHTGTSPEGMTAGMTDTVMTMDPEMKDVATASEVTAEDESQQAGVVVVVVSRRAGSAV